MTIGELCDILQTLPPKLPVLLQVEREVVVENAVNDRVYGKLDASFHIADIDLSKRFSLGKGWHSAVFLVADQEA